MTADYPFPVDRNEFMQKRILVTGGTKGMGEAIVRRFTLGGARGHNRALAASTGRSPGAFHSGGHRDRFKSPYS
jgi:NAD(P)-dependent dehydrogenase (short-subunit alcohol dehydrogenase family)